MSTPSRSASSLTRNHADCCRAVAISWSPRRPVRRPGRPAVTQVHRTAVGRTAPLAGGNQRCLAKKRRSTRSGPASAGDGAIAMDVVHAATTVDADRRRFGVAPVSTRAQVTRPAAAETWVVVKGSSAMPFSWLPPLKPNQPNQSRPVPRMIWDHGGVARIGQSSRGPTRPASTRAETPDHVHHGAASESRCLSRSPPPRPCERAAHEQQPDRAEQAPEAESSAPPAPRRSRRG